MHAERPFQDRRDACDYGRNNAGRFPRQKLPQRPVWSPHLSERKTHLTSLGITQGSLASLTKVLALNESQKAQYCHDSRCPTPIDNGFLVLALGVAISSPEAPRTGQN